MGDNLGPKGLSRVVEGLQGFLLQIDETEIIAHEADEPNSVVDFLDSEPLASQDRRDVDSLPVHADAAAGGDEDVAVVQRVGELWQAVIGPWRG